MLKWNRTLKLILCLCLLLGCGDITGKQILTGVGPDIDTDTVQTELPPEVWEILRKYREGQVSQLQYSTHFFPDNEGYKKTLAEKLEEAEKLKQLQEAFYNRYISADGVAVIGNDATLDHYFVIAKNVFLVMTSKRPELRDPMRDTFYLTFIGGEGENAWPLITTVPEIEIYLSDNWKGHFIGKYKHIRWYPTPFINDKRIMIITSIAGANYSRDNELMTTVVHELAHAFMTIIDRYFDDDYMGIDPAGKVVRAYDNAREKDLWPDYIHRSSPIEFYAELVEIWFHGIGTHWSAWFETYEEFEAHDPLSYALLDEWFPKVSFWGLWGRDT